DAIDRAADRGTLEALLLDCSLELLHRKLRRLQGERGECHEALRMEGAELRQLLVLNLHDLGSEIAIAVVPKRIDRQDLHVDSLRIHRREPLANIDIDFLCTINRRQLGLETLL